MISKRWLYLALLLILVLTTTACSSTISPTASSTTSKTITPTATTSVSQPTSSSSTQTVTTTLVSTSIIETTLTVYFIDVGQGDSILLDQGTTEILIDGGTGQTNVASYIKQYVDGSLEAIVATHPDADHIGGLTAVLNAYKVNDVWTNGESSTSNTYKTFISAIQANGAINHIVKRGDTISEGALSFSVLNPSSLTGDANNDSVVLNLKYGSIDILLTGDAEQPAEASMLAAGVVQHADILKVGHHGSRTASTSQFLSVVKPDVAVYSCGIGNSYGHPHQETITALYNIGATIYGTDVDGTVSVTTGGNTYNIQTQKQAAPIKPSSVSPTTATTTVSTTTAATTTTTTAPITTTAGTKVQITKIFYDGVVPTVESDEYVEITNQGSTSVDLKGWVLKDVSEGYPSFTFPSYVLQTGSIIRVYTNEVHAESGGFRFGSGKAVWNNSSPDMAALYNLQGQEVSRKSY